MSGSPIPDRLAVVALETMRRSRPEITALLIVHIDDVTYLRTLIWDIRPTRRVGPLLPPNRRRNLALAPQFEDVRLQVMSALAGRTVVISDHADYGLLRDRLPDQELPPRVLLFREVRKSIPAATMARIPYARITGDAITLQRVKWLRLGRLKWRWT